MHHTDTATNGKPVLQEDVNLTFSHKGTGLDWEAYIDLFCAGTKQLYFHEKPRLELELETTML